MTPPQPDTETLLVVVRAALGHTHGWKAPCKPCPPHAALDALAARLAEAEAERDEWERRYEELLAAAGGVWPG